VTAAPSVMAVQYSSATFLSVVLSSAQEKIRRAFRKRFYFILFYFYFLVAFAELRKATVNFVISCLCPSVYPFAWNNSASTGRILVIVDILSIFRKYVEKNCFIEMRQDKGHYA
jgi:hypothetical protein